jgi:hypothetical protein
VAKIFEPARISPVALDVKPTVYVVTALIAVRAAVNEVPVAGVAALIVALPFATVVSLEVLICSTVAPAPGFVIPSSVKLTAVFAPTPHVPALLASVTVNTWPEPAPVAEQFVKPLVRPTVDAAGTAKPAG